MSTCLIPASFNACDNAATASSSLETSLFIIQASVAKGVIIDVSLDVCVCDCKKQAGHKVGLRPFHHFARNLKRSWVKQAKRFSLQR